MEKENFNALMAAYRNEETVLSHYSCDEVTSIAINALNRIRELTNTLSFERHHDLIANVLLVGLPKTIHQRLSKSISMLQKGNETLLKYLPHTALASALCLFSTQNAEAAIGWKWGSQPDGPCECGYGCSEGGSSPGVLCDACLNPIFYSIGGSGSANTCLAIVCQAPKFIIEVISGLRIIASIGSAFKRASQLKQVAKQEKILKNKQETVAQNKKFLVQYTDNVINHEQYFTNLSVSCRSNENIKSLINTASTIDDEVLTKNHHMIQQIESLVNGIQEDRLLFESAYNIHKNRLKINTGRKLALFESDSSRKLATLLTVCTTKPERLATIAYEDFSKTDAYRLWQQLDEFEVISSNAKNEMANLNRQSINTIQDKSLAEILSVYKQLSNLANMIDNSHQELFKLHLSDIDMIHKDWNGYFQRLKNN